MNIVIVIGDIYIIYLYLCHLYLNLLRARAVFCYLPSQEHGQLLVGDIATLCKVNIITVINTI